MDLDKLQQVMSDIAGVMHPAIDLSLTELGIVKDIDPQEKTVEVLFAFPFANIPIADKLVGSVKEVIEKHKLDFKHETVVMNDEERREFMRLEQMAWKGGGAACSGCS